MVTQSAECLGISALSPTASSKNCSTCSWASARNHKTQPLECVGLLQPIIQYPIPPIFQIPRCYGLHRHAEAHHSRPCTTPTPPRTRPVRDPIESPQPITEPSSVSEVPNPPPLRRRFPKRPASPKVKPSRTYRVSPCEPLRSWGRWNSLRTTKPKITLERETQDNNAPGPSTLSRWTNSRQHARPHRSSDSIGPKSNPFCPIGQKHPNGQVLRGTRFFLRQ